jgi:electron transfer flavoprotein alpha subunit
MNDVRRGCILVVAEHRQGRLLPISYEVVACARKIEKARPLELVIAVLGEHIETLADQISNLCRARVIAIQGPGLALYHAETFQDALEQLVHELQPAYICVGHTSQGADFAPGLAVRLKAACIAGVERVGGGGNGPWFSRIAYDGKVLLDIRPKTPMCLLTVMPGAFTLFDAGEQNRGSVETRDFSAPPARSKALGIKTLRPSNAALSVAKVIVAAGLGIGRPDNVALVERLAALFPQSAVAGSRPVCDHGWIAYANQVGMTGVTVAPDLYFACGISGSRQHTVGMAASKFIVAISVDPNAAIFQLADIGIVDDLNVFIPIFIEQYRDQES